MGSIIWVSLSPMVPQFLAGIAASLESEYLQVLNTNITVEQLVFPSHVILELLKSFERPLSLPVLTNVAAMFQDFVISFLDVRSAKE